MKNNLLGEKVLSCSFYLYRFRKYVSYGFPIINFCNSGVHYETPCIICAPVINYCRGEYGGDDDDYDVDDDDDNIKNPDVVE
jgi:hypothetical protein